MKTVFFIIAVLLVSLGGEIAQAQSARENRLILRWLRDRPVITSIEVSGNQYFDDGEIRKRLYSRTSSFWHRLNGDRRSKVQRESVGRDTLEIKYLYITNGFINPRIQISFEPILPDSVSMKSFSSVEGKDVPDALMHVKIEEGRQWFVETVLVADSLEFWYRPRIENITKKIKPKSVINLLQLAEAVSEIKTLYANNGYPYAQISYTIDTTTREPSSPIVFHITPDSLVHFGEISIEGVKKYPEKTVRRELAFNPGDIYSRKKIISSQSRLFSSGYFSSANISEAEESGSRTRPDLLVRVRERKSRYTTLRTGVGQSESRDLIWDLSGNFGQRNFLGSRKLDIGALYSFSFGSDSRLVTHRYQFQYTEPWLFHIRMPLIVTLQYEPPLQSVLQEYDIESWKLSASTTRELGSKVIVGGGFEYQSVNITGIPQSEEELKRQEEGLSIRRKMYSSIRRDSRNNLFVPEKGSLVEVSTEYFGGFLGGDDNFYQFTAGWSRYQKVWPGWIAASRIKGGWGRAFGDSKDIPREERFYLGGANTVRGYTENTLGPLREDGSPDGANQFILLNQEFRWKTIQVLAAIPLLGRLFAEFPLWQSVFVDAGNGFVNEPQVRLSNIAVSYGTGLQLISPAGPIRVDYSRRVETDRFPAGERWHFTILYAF